MNSLYLTDEETVLLDGQCSEKAQAIVDGAKARLAAIKNQPDVPPHISGFVADVVRLTEKQKALGLRFISLRHCKLCRKGGGYAKYKSGRRKGDDNWDKPLYLRGVDLEISSVAIQGVAGCGCCFDCWEQAKPLVVEAVRDLEAEIPATITGEPPRWKRYQKVHCEGCQWDGNEGQMGKLPALFGGYYPGQCPSCGAKNQGFGPTRIKHLHGEYVAVKIEEKVEEVKNNAW